VIRVLLEVLVEQVAELVDLGLEAVVSGGPGMSWVEEFRWDVRAGLWHGQVEDLVVLVLDLLELARVDGVEDGARVLERAALAAGGGTGADPAGVEQPGAGLVLLDPLGEHLGVAHWVESQEGLGEAGGEGGFGLGDTLLGAGHLGGVAGDEVEHGLCGVELGDGWKDTAGVAGEEDDVRWVVGGDARNLGVVDVLNWVSAVER